MSGASTQMSLRTVSELLRIDCAHTVTRIVTFVKDTVTESGLQNVVLGLSGGVDSALVAALCTQAVGPSRVFPFLLPYKRSADASRTDALAVAGQLKIQAETIDITPVADAYAGPRHLDDVRKGNVLARVRMLILFDQAKERGALVAGTGNKTETYLGYSTWYGDSACSFLPIADLYKSQVWQLAEFLKLPAGVITKAPTADLWPGQTDEEELGVEYAEVDAILHALLDRGDTAGVLADLGIDAARVKHVVDTMRRTAYKRSLPPVALLSDPDSKAPSTT